MTQFKYRNGFLPGNRNKANMWLADCLLCLVFAIGTFGGIAILICLFG